MLCSRTIKLRACLLPLAVLHNAAEVACHCIRVASNCCCPDSNGSAHLQVSAGPEKQAEIYTYECDDTVFGMNWSVSLQLCSNILKHAQQ